MNRTQLLITAGLVIILIALGLYANNNQASDKGSIKLGLSSPMTGEAAGFGEAWAGGAELAVKDINERGGIDGRLVELVIEDSRCVTATGATIFNKFISVDQVDAIVGPLCSPTAGAGLPIAQEAGVPVIIGASAPSLTRVGDYIFRNYPSDASQAGFSAEFIFNTLQKKNVAVLYVNSDWGIELKDKFVHDFEALGGTITIIEGSLQEATEVRGSVAKIKDTNPEAVYLALFPQTGAAAIKQLKEANVNVPLVGTDLFATDEIYDVPEAEGVLFTLPISKAPQDFTDRVVEETGRAASEVSGFSYDAVMIFAQAFDAVGTDKDAVRDYLDKLTYENGVSVSTISFDENGDLEGGFLWDMRIVTNGENADYAE